jgi:hypothetical protein
LLRLREWVFLARWQDLATILLHQIKVWVDLVNPVPVQVEHLVQLVPVAHLVQVEHLVQQVLAELLVQVDSLHVQVPVPQVVRQAELLLLVPLVVDQVLVAAVAVAAQPVLSVKVDLVTLLRQESRRE